MVNRKMWVNAVIGEFQAELEVIRQGNFENKTDDDFKQTRCQLLKLIGEYDEKLDFRPFEDRRRNH